MLFEWDAAKAAENLRKHGLSFEEAQRLFEAEDYLELFDDAHSELEERFIAIGPISRGIITTIFTERVDDVIRIICARMATQSEIKLFHQYMDRQ